MVTIKKYLDSVSIVYPSSTTTAFRKSYSKSELLKISPGISTKILDWTNRTMLLNLFNWP